VQPISYSTSTDNQLIRAARNGDHMAFSALVKRYQDTVYRFSFKVCRDREKAEEALQDTFVNVYRKLGSFDGKAKFTTWLYRIVANNCLMKRRRRKLQDLQDPLESFDEPPAHRTQQRHHPVARWEDAPEQLLLNKELQEILDRAIMKLPLDYRMAFVLRDVEGKSTEEASQILAISQEALKSRLRRARAFLREQLNPYLTVEAENESL